MFDKVNPTVIRSLVMKFVIVLALCIATVVAIDNEEINWSKVKNLNLDPIIPVVPQARNGPTERITKGQTAEPKQFPHQVGLMLYAHLGRYWCGGSLISKRWVLTAAHCTDDLDQGVDVYLGAWNRRDINEKHQSRIFVETRNVIVHEDWNPSLIVNDISLIKLPVIIEFNEYVSPINLPRISSSYETYDGKAAFASGWGQTSDKKEESSSPALLQWAQVPIMTNKGCGNYYLGSIKPTHICIKTKGGASICGGDSGGPLQLADGTNTLVGITSFGIGFGCEKGWPGVFTRVTSYLEWIENVSGVANRG